MEFNRFDVTNKELVWSNPAAWLKVLGIGPGSAVEVVDSDITTLTAAADKVLRVGGARPFLVNFEFQSGRDAGLIDTLCFRQSALTHRHGLTVLTVLVLLRKEADSPKITGSREFVLPDGRVTSRYDYQVVRIWREDPETFLAAEVELVPLAPLTNIRENELPDIIDRMDNRIRHESDRAAAKLWTATFLLMGLRYSREKSVKLLERVRNMKESTTYQLIIRQGKKEGKKEGVKIGVEKGVKIGVKKGVKIGVEKGRIREAKQMILRLGTMRFQAPSPEYVSKLQSIDNLRRLEMLIDKILDPSVKSWHDFLDDL